MGLAALGLSLQAAGCTLPDTDQQSLRLVVHTLAAPPDLVVEAEYTWLGEERSQRLRDDGVDPDEAAGDGVFTGSWTGAPVRMLPVRLLVSREVAEVVQPVVGAPVPQVAVAVPVEAYAGIEVLSLDDDELAWSLELDAPPRARRVPVARSSRQVAFLELVGVGGSLLWAVLVMGVVIGLVRRFEALGPGEEG